MTTTTTTPAVPVAVYETATMAATATLALTPDATCGQLAAAVVDAVAPHLRVADDIARDIAAAVDPWAGQHASARPAGVPHTETPANVYRAAEDAAAAAVSPGEISLTTVARIVADAVAPLLIQHGRNLAADDIAAHLGDMLDYDQDEADELVNIARDTVPEPVGVADLLGRTARTKA